MNSVKKISVAALTTLIFFSTALIASAQTTPNINQGPNCDTIGNGRTSGAQQRATGIYVPVADYVVELNTFTATVNANILTYKECVLRLIIDAQRKQATAQLQANMINSVETGRNGNPLYPRQVEQELENVAVSSAVQGLRDVQNAPIMNQAMRAPVTAATAHAYYAQTKVPYSILDCPVQGDLNAFAHAQPNTFTFERLDQAADPACNPLDAYYLESDLIGARAAVAEQIQRDEWAWANGYYSRVTNTDTDPLNETIVTPGIIIQESLQTYLDTGFIQLQNANDIGQMVQALFAGVNNQVVSSNNGLTGLNQSVGGQPSYLSQLANQLANGTTGAITNAALQALTAARAVEQSYFQAVSAILNMLQQTVAQLRSTENQCWNIIIPAVQNYAQQNSLPLTHIATSTQFSQAVINANISPLSSTTLSNINASTNALRIIDQLIQTVSNTTNQTVQNQALTQLNTLTANGTIHSSQNVATAQGQLNSVQSNMTSLVQNTISAWSTGNDPIVNWCNINNQAVLQRWQQAWQ